MKVDATERKEMLVGRAEIILMSEMLEREARRLVGQILPKVGASEIPNVLSNTGVALIVRAAQEAMKTVPKKTVDAEQALYMAAIMNDLVVLLHHAAERRFGSQGVPITKAVMVSVKTLLADTLQAFDGEIQKVLDAKREAGR